ncbi:MAG TPA: hypothetical protein VKZ84_04760, partial [Bacteriovoracaceae bacterium]|nr:hypothetical protein [Bacteriovoracaceae bacterium]
KKIDSQLAYRMFMSSANDYLVHGIRERWCLNYENGVSDLLLSNHCSSKASMEDIVTYPGNLERVLWGPETIGNKLDSAPSIENANKILSLNYLRFQSKKTNRELDVDDIVPKDGKLNFRITESVLKDMNDSHPLYLMSRKIMDCVNHIDVEVFQVRDFANLATGEESKVGIRITADIKKTRMSCMAIQRAESISYYTFYPRRLHTFSLVKYGDLDGNHYNEFHGPVYVAGNFILPPKDSNKEQTTVFYDSLTLGIFNGGSRMKKLIPGQILSPNKSVYTFSERGHPYLSKQDNYEGFRGFLGGVKLDSSEDKGFYNLFDHTSSTAADLGLLEACIEDNQSRLVRSKNANSRFLYNAFSKSNESVKIKVSFDQKNRFDISDQRPRILSAPKGSRFDERHFTIRDKNTSKSDALADVRFYIEDKGGHFLKTSRESYEASIGDGSSVLLDVDFEKFNLAVSNLESYQKNLENVNRTNYYKLIDSDALKTSSEYREFDSAARALISKCDQRITVDCQVVGYKAPKCAPNPPRDNDGGGGGRDRDGGGGRDANLQQRQEEDQFRGQLVRDECTPGDYASEVNRYNQAKTRFNNKISELKQFQEQKNTSLEVKVEQVTPHKGQTVLNQRNIQMNFSEGWREYFKLIYGSISKFEMSFTPYHNGFSNSLSLNFDFMGSSSGNNPRIITKNFFSTSTQELKSSWSNTKNNDPVPTPDPLVELNCPQGMNLADWDLDMSPSSNFAWNYANTPAGAFVDTNDHEQAAPIIFHPGTPPLEGHAYSTTKSVVQECIIPSTRTHVYGFYVCNKLTIQDRTTPLYMIGTFIVAELSLPRGSQVPIHWHSIWDAKSTDLIMTDLNGGKANCSSVKDLTSKTWKDVVANSHIAATVDSCGPLDLVSNGPNNFSWTTVDPDVGIANAGDVMTSQKVNRVQRWVIREESRSDLIR